LSVGRQKSVFSVCFTSAFLCNYLRYTLYTETVTETCLRVMSTSMSKYIVPKCIGSEVSIRTGSHTSGQCSSV